MPTLFSTACGCCLVTCEEWRACFSDKTILMTFFGITGTNCSSLNTSYEYAFGTISSPTCVRAVNGEEYDGDYCITGICDGSKSAAPEWQFGINETTGNGVCQVGYDFRSGLGGCAATPIGVMNFGHNASGGEDENRRALAALSGLCKFGVAVLPFSTQGVGVCCDGSAGIVILEMS